MSIKKPNDAIHLACALFAGCDVLLTWDHKDLLKLQGTVPGIRIEAPQIFGQPRLPERQTDASE
jgi:predicted nucleic acid-binding protein